MKLIFILLILGIPAGVAAAQTAAPNQAQLAKMASRFATSPMRVDVSALSSGDRQALVKLLEAARVLDDIFLKQLWSGNLALYHRLERDKTPAGRARFHYFWINKGPWSDIDEYKAFIPGVPRRKPLVANFYPEDMTKDGFEHWLSSLTPEEQEQAKSFFTVIRYKTPAPKPTGFLGPPEKLHDGDRSLQRGIQR